VLETHARRGQGKDEGITAAEESGRPPGDRNLRKPFGDKG
jgi:hypothetical protein